MGGERYSHLSTIPRKRPFNDRESTATTITKAGSESRSHKSDRRQHHEQSRLTPIAFMQLVEEVFGKTDGLLQE